MHEPTKMPRGPRKQAYVERRKQAYVTRVSAKSVMLQHGIKHDVDPRHPTSNEDVDAIDTMLAELWKRDAQLAFEYARSILHHNTRRLVGCE